MNDDRIDLNALDPTGSGPAFERRLAAIRTAAAGELARRRARPSAFSVVARWRVPLLAALLVVTVVSLAMLRSAPTGTGTTLETAMDTPDDVAEVLGVSSSVSAAAATPATSPIDALLGGYDQ